RWTYTWDAENRLMAMEAMATVPVAAKLELEFAYNYQSRRIQKRVYSWNASSGSYQLQSTTRFVYGGWNLVAELDASDNLIRSYLWGQDLSGTLQGAGGIGGLLVISDSGESYIPSYDGNGNVIALTKGSSGSFAASYEFSPFGETLVQIGDYATTNPFGIGVKYKDQETDFVYYGYRHYVPVTGRWLGRDPSEEIGDRNLYGFVYNAPTDFIDADGRIGLPTVPSRWFKPKPHKEQLRETTLWTYTIHSLEVKCLRETDFKRVKNFVYDDFSRFASLNDPQENVAAVRLTPDGMAYFDLKNPVNDILLNLVNERFPVYLKGNNDDETKAITAGGHPLVGVRKWRVDQLSPNPLDINMVTEAWERPRGIFNRLGESLGREDQKALWTIYLKNIGAKIKARFGGELGEVKVPPTIQRGPMPNPFDF
ncbi:MAG: RHS repeat-associated core domain-containing protein, partial [Acidobacteriota bacterium]